VETQQYRADGYSATDLTISKSHTPDLRF